MIPIFPFAHTPPGGPDYRLEWNGGRVAVAAHFMENYTASIGDVGWNGIRHTSDRVNWDQRAKKWLETSASDGVMMFSARVLWMISSALRWVLKKIAIGVIGVTLTAGVTVVDQLAWMLHQGVAASREIAGYVETLIVAILRFLGRTVTTAVRLTVAFIRWVMDLLFSTLQNVTTRALNLMPFG